MSLSDICVLIIPFLSKTIYGEHYQECFVKHRHVKHLAKNKQIGFYQNKLDYEMDPSDLFSALEKGENIVPLDTRNSFLYEKEHIPRSINLYHREMNGNSPKSLHKTKTYACYCNGIGCNGSTRGCIKHDETRF